MVVAIQIDARAKEAINLINNIKVKVPKEIDEGGFEFAELNQRNLRAQLTRNRTIWRRKLWASIQARRLSKNRSIVVMANYGVWLDRARPHWVKLKRGRNIHKWAMKKGSPGLKAAAKAQRSIYVRPHPFIDEAYAKSLTRLPVILQRRLNKGLRGG